MLILPACRASNPTELIQMIFSSNINYKIFGGEE